MFLMLAEIVGVVPFSLIAPLSSLPHKAWPTHLTTNSAELYIYIYIYISLIPPKIASKISTISDFSNLGTYVLVGVK